MALASAKGRRAAWHGFLLTVAASSTAFFLFLLAGPVDTYGFLSGHRPAFSGVFPRMEVDSFTGPGESRPPSEYRVYSWQENYREVRKKATQELARLGFKIDERAKPDQTWTSWHHSRHLAVFIQSGPGRTRREAFGNSRSNDASWVTVTIGNDAPDNWITFFRAWIEPSDY
ncbi:MAG: hypothetical protein IT203_08850 [Fimbriimonadaceae bacterium]|nr:hypothetical protein [Fimbriimonadaceae bacterium]